MSVPAKCLSIERGSFRLYCCFDVGDEIRLDGVDRVLGKPPVPLRLHHQRLTPAYMQYRRAPLLVELDPVRLGGDGGAPIEVACQAKLYEFGVVSLIYEVPFRGDLPALQAAAAQFAEHPELESITRVQLNRLVDDLRRAGRLVKTPYERADSAMQVVEGQTYLVFFAQQLEPAHPARALLAASGSELARLLRQERDPLSEGELEDALRQRLSYYADELVLIDWNAAFFYDPRRSFDVADVLEYAVIMLLELRTYDALLDAVLDRAYDDLERKHTTFNPRPFAATIRFLAEIKLAVSEVIEKVTNALKLIGDPYLAKVYNAAATRFHLRTWEDGIREKLATVETLYRLLHDRAQTRAMLVLETLIVLLFVLDIALLLLEPLVFNR